MSDPKHTAVAVIERSPVPERLHPMVKAAMAQAPDPATLRELLAVQREWEAGEAKREYSRALVALKADLPASLDRDKEVDFTSQRTGTRTNYRHTTLAHAIDTVTPHLTRHGFSLAWVPETSKDGVTVTCRLTHAGGHSEQASISAPIDTSGNKSPAQGVASTITLLQRYTALSILGIATADMVEPTPKEPEPTAINSARNLKAAAALKKYGKTREEAEKKIGRPVSEWTASDLDALAAWLKSKKEETAEDPHVVNAAKAARDLFEGKEEPGADG